MKLLPVLATLVMTLSLCNMLNRNSNQSNTNSGNTNSATTPTSGGGATAMSEDDKHKLFQAAGMTRDQDTILEVSRKIGLIDQKNMPANNYQDFVKGHMDWAVKNAAFIREVSTPEKAKEYVEKHK